MKKIIITTLLIICFPVLIIAEEIASKDQIYIIVENSTDEIISLSNEDDAVMPEGNYKKYIVDMKLSELELEEHPIYYKYKNNKFIKNIKKISDEELDKEKKQKKMTEFNLIKNKIYYDACIALEIAGQVFEEITCSEFE